MSATIERIKRKTGRPRGPGRRLVGLFLPPAVYRSAMAWAQEEGYPSLGGFFRQAGLERMKAEGWREPVAHPQENLPGL